MSIKEEAYKELTEHIIPFWKRLRDNEFGGFYGMLDYNLVLDKKATKGCILNSRILWFFSKGYLVLKDKSLLEYAEHAYKFLVNYCIDKDNGGVFWSLNYDGTVCDSTKHTYNQAFAIYALSAYYNATKDATALDNAYRIYEIIETKCKDEGGYLEAFTKDFKPQSNEKLSENGVMAERTMNTLLHVFEGYSGLYEAEKSNKVYNSLRYILDIFENKVYNKTLGRQEVFFDRNYNSLIDLYSYGHDIETSWLLDWGTSLLGDNSLTSRISSINSTLAENIYKYGYKEHCLYAECEKGVDNKNRVWWVQAEAVLGFINAYQKTGEEKYRKAYNDIFEFIKEHQIDKRNGSEWFSELDENNNPIKEKQIVEPWKCPYHNGRMCYEILRRL